MHSNAPSTSSYAFTFPTVPPSINACYRVGGKRVYKSKQLRAYETEMNEFFDMKGNLPLLEGNLALEVTFRFQSMRKRDLDNCLKPLLDSLEGRLFANDNQIAVIHAQKSHGHAVCTTEIVLQKLGSASEEECNAMF